MSMSTKRITGVGRSLRQAAPEPLHPLRGRAVREAIRHHVTRRHPLQSIVANRRRGAQALLDVAGVELHLMVRGAPGLRRGMTPDAGEAVGLQLEANG